MIATFGLELELCEKRRWLSCGTHCPLGDDRCCISVLTVKARHLTGQLIGVEILISILRIATMCTAYHRIDLGYVFSVSKILNSGAIGSV